MFEFYKSTYLSTVSIGRVSNRVPVLMAYSHLNQGSFGFNVDLFASDCPLHFGLTLGHHCFYVQLFARFGPVLP